MRRIIAILGVFCLFSTLLACSPPVVQRDFAYAEEAFSVSVSGTYLPASDPNGTPRSFAATISAGAPVSGDPSLRDLSLVFTHPASLQGVAVAAVLSSDPAAGGEVTRRVTFTYPSEYGEVKATATGREFDGLLRFAEALLPLGDVTAVSPVAEDGTHTVTRSGDGRTVTFTFAEDSEFPVSFRLTDARGTVDCTVRPAS